jgi:hypothetical protein
LLELAARCGFDIRSVTVVLAIAAASRELKKGGLAAYKDTSKQENAPIRLDPLKDDSTRFLIIVALNLVDNEVAV